MTENKQDLGTTDLGIQPNLAALITYIPFFIGLIAAVIFFVIEKQNKFVRFHALQSILLTIGLIIISTVFAFIPFIGWAILPLVSLLSLILLIVLMIKAYQGEWFKLPVIGDIAEKNS